MIEWRDRVGGVKVNKDRRARVHQLASYALNSSESTMKS